MRGFWLLAAAVLVLTGIGVAVESTQPSPVIAPSSAAPFTLVNWVQQSYPGLDCGTFPAGVSPIVVERVLLVPVRRKHPAVALVEVTCNLNHLYAHLYVFVRGSDPAHPVLLQRLTPAGTWLWQDIGLTTELDRITLKAAGTPPIDSPSFRGLCCPNLVSFFRWVWTGNQFAALPPKAVESLVVPNVLGYDLTHAGHVLAAAGFPGIDLGASPNADPNGLVIAEHPSPGTVVHSPFPIVTIDLRS